MGYFPASPLLHLPRSPRIFLSKNSPAGHHYPGQIVNDKRWWWWWTKRWLRWRSSSSFCSPSSACQSIHLTKDPPPPHTDRLSWIFFFSNAVFLTMLSTHVNLNNPLGVNSVVQHIVSEKISKTESKQGVGITYKLQQLPLPFWDPSFCWPCLHNHTQMESRTRSSISRYHHHHSINIDIQSHHHSSISSQCNGPEYHISATSVAQLKPSRLYWCNWKQLTQLTQQFDGV